MLNNEVKMKNLNFLGVTSLNWHDVIREEVAPGIYQRPLWEGDKGKRASILEFEPGAKYPGIDIHLSGPEQIFVVSGVFNDGKKDHKEGSFINNPVGSSHIPQSKLGCIILIIYPEG
ncbi:cupin domain-containing protein [Vibrio rotiferianus]|jgi:anti-sigma factor ChrR (cupin superfamily)